MESVDIIRVLNIQLRDVLDIALVGVFLYFFFQLFKGTRAVQMFFGFLLLALVFGISQWLDLRGVQWLFSNLLTVGVVSLVILFQPELRGALTRIGQTASQKSIARFLFEPEELEETITALVVCCRNLSRKRHGALIVLEQNIGLKTYLDSGVGLDAQVTPALLESIFFPKSPLHDGAVIINGDRIQGAACTLPLLPFEERGHKNTGMRHSAAEAIAQESDAIVLVVSEETGGISLVQRNRFLRGISPERLTKELNNLLLEDKK